MFALEGHKMQGKFICFDGIDFSGKTTVAKMVVDWLKANKIDAIYTKHPGSTPIGQELRKVAKESNSSIDENTEALIMASDNSAFISQLLEPALRAGTWVIGDRNNFISSMAYQTASGCSFEQLDKVHAATAVNPPKIDLLLIFRISPETHAARQKMRVKTVKDNFEDRGNSYTKKVIKAYDDMVNNVRISKFVKCAPTPIVAENVNGEKVEFMSDIPQCLYIDANKSVDDVYNDCRRAICSIIPELYSTVPDTKYGRPNN